MTQQQNNPSRPEIWAVGGGKGGTGKSFLSSSLGIYLAQGGSDVVLLDADFGTANLHSFIRVERPERSLSDFFLQKQPLDELLVDTNIKNLRFVAGHIHDINPASITYGQKLKLFRHIRNLKAKYVIIDLGAGTSLNTLDTFLLADRMIVVTLPELTSVENLYIFIKKALFRKIQLIMRNHKLQEQALAAWKQRPPTATVTIQDFISCLRGISYEVYDLIEVELSQFVLQIILNQIRNVDQFGLGVSLRSVMIKHFGFPARFLGAVEYIESFWKFINHSLPYIRLNSHSSISDEIGSIVRNVIESEEINFSRFSHG